jgi:N utilization substance protein B
MFEDNYEMQKVVGRRKLREIVFKVLFGLDFNNKAAIENIQEILYAITDEESQQYQSIEKDIVRYIEGIYAFQESIDEIIKENLFHWSWDRLMPVDKNILRLATYELIYEPDVPIEVSLNEAVEMAKEYGTDKSSKFVNGILDVVAKKHVSQEKKQL